MSNKPLSFGTSGYVILNLLGNCLHSFRQFMWNALHPGSLQGNGNGANSSVGISTSEGSVDKFQDVKQFKDFKIYVDGLVVDSELSSSDKMTYYLLCCSQEMFLHGHLIEGLGSKLVVVMICITADIATAIKSLSVVPSLEDFECWDVTLKSFEDLGMGVGFLRARIHKLFEISRKYETVNESYVKVEHVLEKIGALKKEVSTMDALAESIAALKASIESVEAEMDAIKEEMKDIDTEYVLRSRRCSLVIIA